MEYLAGTEVVEVAVNLPGPLTGRRLVDLGARVLKVEPPAGDPLQKLAPVLYEYLNRSKQVVRWDLKSGTGRTAFVEALDGADLLLTAYRPDSLGRLELAWPDLHDRCPKLCHLGIVGYTGKKRNLPGHDLTYQALASLLEPPALPAHLLADVTGAERAVSTALALLLQRARTGGGLQQWVSLSASVDIFTRVRATGLVEPGQLLGGGRARYQLYRAADGWVAVGALEDRLWRSLVEALELPEKVHESEAEAFRLVGRKLAAGTIRQWNRLAVEGNLPLVAF